MWMLFGFALCAILPDPHSNRARAPRVCNYRWPKSPERSGPLFFFCVCVCWAIHNAFSIYIKRDAHVPNKERDISPPPLSILSTFY